MPDPLYRERLYPPPLWWVLAIGLALSFALAAGFYLGPGWAIGVGGATLLVAAALLGRAAIRISIDRQAVQVGRGRLELEYLGGCRALDAAAASARSGPEADARAHLVLRPYVRAAVELEVVDPIDPVPYWLISTRHPQRLAAAVARARTPAG